MDGVNYSYDGKFEGNILVVGRTRCGKTTFVQTFGKNKLFRDNYLKKFIGSLKLNFLQIERAISGTVSKTKM